MSRIDLFNACSIVLGFWAFLLFCAGLVTGLVFG